MESPVRMRCISLVKEDVLVLAASYGPLPREEFFHHTVRGVTVEITRQTKVDDRNVSYRLCVFPGFRLQWVNEGNIRSRKLARTGVIADEPASKAA
jgi:hypothetical protein